MKEIKVKMNPTREKVLAVLKDADGEMTLAEISEAAGVEVKTGTTNAMLAAGLIKKVGTKKVAKTVYVEVATYAIGE
jgi:Fe2+ or Zn2+ uptake regulation protein